MTVHLIKLAVGVEDVAHLARIQARRLEEFGFVFHRTRMMPKRVADLTDGGSAYWVVAGSIQARQAITALERREDDEGRSFCLIRLDPRLVPVEARPQRPFQGWRYLTPEEAPPDRRTDEEAPPPEMLEDLRRLGLWW